MDLKNALGLNCLCMCVQALLIFCCIMGLFDGCFITMMGPIAFDICGPAGAGQAIGEQDLN